ncbi:MAG: TetR/AcrR family transcriptional regulator [Hyphomicrobiales bacterium]|nr:TetR/AcrR family transcriptional regulator [Hyphomicrobiales bacterium]
MSPEKAARRREILEAAGAEFCEKGYAAATTLGLARRARISKRDLYALFGSKQGVMEALIGAYTQTMTLTTLAPPRNAADFLATLETFGAAFLAQLLDEQRVLFYRLAIAEAPQSEFARILHERGIAPVKQSVSAFLTQAVAAGIVRPQDALLLADVFFGALIGQTQIETLLGLTAPPDEEARRARAKQARAAVERLLTP